MNTVVIIINVIKSFLETLFFAIGDTRYSHLIVIDPSTDLPMLIEIETLFRVHSDLRNRHVYMLDRLTFT